MQRGGSGRKGRLFPERVLAQLAREGGLELPRTRHRLILGDSRRMAELRDGEVHLVVTSPPYPMIELWDQFFESQRCQGYSAMHDYLEEVWRECYRVLADGGIMCINIGDALRKVEGRFRLYPNHAEILRRCEHLGFTPLPYILWKKPTNRPDAFLGSGFLPPNAYVTLDCEYILIFRKGAPRRFKPKDPYRYLSYYTKEERDAWFTQIWEVRGERQEVGEVERRTAAYPEEIPYRLIRMFSIIGDTVLDPFLGTGTTTRVAVRLHRNSVGYEIDCNLLRLATERLGLHQKRLTDPGFEVEVLERTT